MKDKLPFILGGVAILIASGVFLLCRSGRASDIISKSIKSTSPVRIYAENAKNTYINNKFSRHFEHLDLDHDQKISRDEYLAGRKRAFERLDKNHDNMLSFDEYAASAVRHFDQADQDHDEFLNKEDLASIDRGRNHEDIK
ncbi:EF hand [Zymomonas mobilis subsp. mobilis str. CP4 = NRRL B-14023]|uniref:histidine kinase n=1 Tax=Zymomonas mobilis TaxID=542 RepID=UPI0003F1F692|nr:histidine kinase [Zymomonas mobilis]AHJ72077.1 EF hand [Zymomonas mobilis subsp. mobilis str. CP4 = NRRL B-14023]